MSAGVSDEFPLPWRQGHDVRVNVYDADDEPVMQAKTPELAALIVKRVNRPEWAGGESILGELVSDEGLENRRAALLAASQMTARQTFHDASNRAVFESLADSLVEWLTKGQP